MDARPRPYSIHAERDEGRAWLRNTRAGVPEDTFVMIRTLSSADRESLAQSQRLRLEYGVD